MAQPFFRKIILYIFLGCFSIIYSQNKISLIGEVVNVYKFTGIEHVVVSIQNTSFTQVTNKNGSFIFCDLPQGEYYCKIEHYGFESLIIPFKNITGKTTDLGKIILKESIESDQKNQLISLTEDQLSEDNNAGNHIIFLQSNKDAFQKAAAFNFSPFRFNLRGLDNAYSTVSINGIVMNKLYDGRPQWNNWGGLNDITRNNEITNGTKSSDQNFGLIAGIQNFNTRASFFKPTAKITLSETNTHYNHRAMATYASGLSNKGWAYVLSLSKRWAKEAYFEGTTYDANSIFGSVEKVFNDTHSINFTMIFAQNTRGKNSSNTQEVNDLAGNKYNSFWGYQNGEKRNSRIREIEEPILIFSHFWNKNKQTQIQSNLSYQWGKNSNSRLDFGKTNNPDPTYYKNLPSYYLTQVDAQNNHTPNFTEALKAQDYFLNHSQINWNELYQTNQRYGNNGQSTYLVGADRNDDKLIHANSNLQTQISNNININAGIAFKHLHSENYKKILDLLGGNYFVDTDAFLTGNAAQSNLLEPYHKAVKGNRYRYNYILKANTIDAFAQIQFNYPKWEIQWAQLVNYTQYQREGLFQNGLFANASLGKSELLRFENLGSKCYVLYKLNGFHFFEFNTAIIEKSPNLSQVFANPRINNNLIPNLKSEKINSVDINYYYRSSKLKSRITAYYAQIKNSNQVSYYYTEGINFNDLASDVIYNSNAFVNEITTGINKKHLGIEISIEYKINPTWQTYFAANMGQYTYANNPNLILNVDNIATTLDLGKVYLKNYKIPNTPQHAYSIGVEYKNPKYWWLGGNINWLTHNYLGVSSILRTDNFYKNPDDISGFPFKNADSETGKNILKQERLDDVFSLNIMGGKSWKIKKQTIGLFATANNILGKQFKIGGYEQARNANYQEIINDNYNGVRAFGPKYFYSYGRTFFVNLYFIF